MTPEPAASFLLDFNRAAIVILLPFGNLGHTISALAVRDLWYSAGLDRRAFKLKY
jgi:hypothetical protein